MAVDVTTVSFAEVRKFVESTFRQVADLKGLEFDVLLEPSLPAGAADRHQAAAAGAQEPPLQCVQVHRAGQRLAPGPGGDGGMESGAGDAERGQHGDRVLGNRYRHRHSQGEARRHLRGLPAGRRHHQPQVRRHRPGPLHQPADHPASGRRNQDRELTGRGQHLYPLPAVDLSGAAGGNSLGG